MHHKLSGKKVLIVKGSLLVPFAVATALTERGAKTVTATNIISAFSLLEREMFDAAVIDKGLHNEAFDLCAELKSLGVPFVLANAPHELQRPAMQMSAACDLVAKLVRRLQARSQDQTQPARRIRGADGLKTVAPVCNRSREAFPKLRGQLLRGFQNVE